MTTSSAFDLFVVFAEMRTGSNYLETHLNRFAGVTCHGEAFNPHFIGYPKRKAVLDVSQEERDADPRALLARMRAAPTALHGFRYFHDHDPRIFDALLDDPRCAKIILTRNPAESYVSWKIAQATNQWKLTDVSKRKASQARFEPEDFDAHLARSQDFQLRLLKGLQHRGQTAFYIGYDDLNDLETINGLAKWLGLTQHLPDLDSAIKPQNPEPLAAKVANFDEMSAWLARYDRFDLTRTPNYEPRRGPVVPGFVAGAHTPLLYQPIRGGPDATILSWMARLDGATPDALQTGFTQKTLRAWLKAHPGHQRFSVLPHPVTRAHRAFCDKILSVGPGSFRRIRNALRSHHNVPLPDADPEGSASYDLQAHQAAFKAFLAFLRRNLNGQTNLRVDGYWASQSAILQGMAKVSPADRLIREADLAEALPRLAQHLGCDAPTDVTCLSEKAPFDLSEVYDAEIETLIRAAYGRDYITFGFSDWRP